MADLERELDRLYGLPLGEFTSARNQLARELEKDGDSQQAARVAGLSKPTLSAWTLNQLAREEGALVQRLLEAGDRLRTAQEQALAGGHADELRQAVSAERDAVRELAQAARGLTDDDGRTISEPVLKRVRASLTAVAANEDARGLLEHGRVTSDFERSGFPALSPAPPAGPKAKPQRPARRGDSDELAERRRRRAEHQQHLQTLRRQLRELKREATQSERDAQRAERKAAEAGAEAEHAEREHRQAIAHATALAAKVGRAEADLTEAETDA